MLHNRLRSLVALLFFLSGATGLVYEIVWTRKLTLVLGGTVYAVTTILTVYFAGLALGALLAGRWIDRGRSPLAAYVGLEFAIGAFGLASPWLFAGLDAFYYAIHPLVSSSAGTLTAARFALSFAALILPTTLMGATLPVLVKLVSRRDEEVAADAGRLYSVNTLGAAVGTFLATLVLQPAFGVNTSLALTGLTNLAIGAAAWWLFRGLAAPGEASAPRAGEGARPSATQRYLLALFGVLGFVSMAYQVAWVRLLIQVTGHTIYTFGLMLGVFIVGIGLGSALMTRWLPRVRSAVVALATVEIVAAGYCLLGVSAFEGLPLLFAELTRLLFVEWQVGIDAFAAVLLVKLGIIAIVLLVPTLMFGAAFPLVSAVYAQSAARAGRDVGAVYAVNTVGGIFGSAIGGFFLLPWLGTQRLIVVMSVLGLLVAVGVALPLARGRARAALTATCALLGIAAAFLYRPWNPAVIDSGPYILRYASAGALLANSEQRKLIYYDEGVNVNVSVEGDIEAGTITINGKPMASTLLTDVANQYLLGHIPMLLHPDPQSAMVIGLGAGMTFSGLVRHGIPADVIEISPEVVAGARLFAKHNRNVLDQPNANLIFDDGRNYLATTRKKYDVITEDPLDPFFMGSGHLYGLEHFQNAKRALNPGGVMCQYLPLYQVGLEEARIIIKTFRQVFPHVTAWFAFNDLLLIGTQEPLRVDLARLRARVARPEIRQDLLESGIDSAEDLLANYLFDESVIPEIGGDLPINTDDYPVIEFQTPRSMLTGTMAENVDYLTARRSPVPPDIADLSKLAEGEVEEAQLRIARTYRAKAHVMRAHLDRLLGRGEPLAELARAAEIAAPDTSARYFAADVALGEARRASREGDRARAIELLLGADRLRPDFAPILNLLARELAEDGRGDEAIELLERSLAIEPRQVAGRPRAARLLAARGDHERARSVLRGCLELDPERIGCLQARAFVELRAAEADIERAIELLRGGARSRAEAGRIAASLVGAREGLDVANRSRRDAYARVPEADSALSYLEAYSAYLEAAVEEWRYAEQNWARIANGSEVELAALRGLQGSSEAAWEERSRALTRLREHNSAEP